MGGNGDGGDERHVADGFGVAFGQDAGGGHVIFLEHVGQEAEPPAEHLHVGGGEDQGQSLRRDVFVVRRVRVWFQGVFDHWLVQKARRLCSVQVSVLTIDTFYE